MENMLREIFPSTIGIYHYLTNNHGDMFEGFLGYGSIGINWDAMGSTLPQLAELFFHECG